MIEPSSQHSERRLSAESVTDVCTFVDDLDGPAGEIVVDCDDARGAVFVEDGRICWAAATGLSRRLSELLVAHTGVARESMEAIFLRCKAERRPLGEFLVAEGIVQPRDLRSALERHTVESLLALTGRGRRAVFRPRPRGGYSPQFTFGTSELLTRASATEDPAAADVAEAELERWLSREAWGAAFVRRPSRATPDPIALRGHGPQTARDLLGLAKWAASALDVVSIFGAKDAILGVLRPECVRVRGRDFLVAWSRGGLVCVGEAREGWLEDTAHAAARGVARP